MEQMKSGMGSADAPPSFARFLETETLDEMLLREIGRLPTENDLPSSDGIPMETDRHVLQLELLRRTLDLFWEGREYYAAGNMFLYFSLLQVKNQDFRGPDFFVVLGVPHREHKSWVVWQEGKAPDVVIEFLSESTAQIDKGEKKQVYQDRVKVPEYFLYDPEDGEWEGFALSEEGVYNPIKPDEGGRLVSRKLGLALVRWDGEFAGFGGPWLRWETLDGMLLPTAEEMAIAAEQKAQAAQQAAQAAQQEAQAAQQEAQAAQQEAQAAQQEVQAAQQEAQAAQQEAQAAQQRIHELEALLARYQNHFGEVPH